MRGACIPVKKSIARLALWLRRQEDSQPNGKSFDQRKNKVAMTIRTQLGFPYRSILVYLAHCSGDHIVDIELGRQSKDVLTSFGHELTWSAPTGGHWINEPGGINGFKTFPLLQMTR